MYAPDYHFATNSAYEILLKCNFELPVRISTIIKQFNGDIKVVSYSKAARKEQKSHSEIVKKFASDYGFITRDPTDPWRSIIYYNDKKSPQTIRFTLAHEIGHYVLGHLDDDDVSQKEANCFARNLLCPVPVRNNLQGNVLKSYVDRFNISERMAQTTIGLLKSDLYYIKEEFYYELASDYLLYELFDTCDDFICDEVDEIIFNNDEKKAP